VPDTAAEATHDLAGKLTVIVAALPVFAAALEALEPGDLPERAAYKVRAARAELVTVDLACRQAIDALYALRGFVRHLTQDT
jgi:hypothetical protein